MLRRRAVALLASASAAVGLLAAVGTAAAALPDGRAYELVSPPDKQSNDAMVSSMKTRIAPDGDAVVFSSLGAFGAGLGAGLETYYASSRSAEGWSSHSLMPKQEPQPYGTAIQNVTPTYDEFSADLERGILFAISPVTDAPNVAATNNLYRRDDVLSPGAGSYELLTDSWTMLTPDTDKRMRPSVVAASTDWTHILFQSPLDLVPEATPCNGAPGLCTPKLYEWVDGMIRLAGVLPDGQPASCPDVGGQVCSSADSPQGYIGPSAMSDDGSRIFFNAPVDVGGDPANGSQVYMRQDESTVRISASESDTPDPGGPGTASFWGATHDGSKAFLVTAKNLTNDATGDGINLYMYDTTRPDSDPDNLTLLSTDGEPSDGLFAVVNGVIGFSDDGSYVYFVSRRQLVAGGPTTPSLSDRIYVWHDGSLRYVGAFPNELEESDYLGAAGRADASVVRRTSRVTPDGRHLLFTAHDGAGLLGYDHGDCAEEPGDQLCREVYVYAYDGAGGTGELVCASCNSSGASATADGAPFAEVGRSNTRSTNYRNHSITDDGRRVFFTSGEPLVTSDDNGRKDAYVYDTETGEHHLLSTGQSPVDSYFLDATPSGDDVLISTREHLVGIDTDDAFDLYDVRVGGGIAAQNPPAAQPECSAEDCHGSASAPPAETAPASDEFLGGSDPLQIDELVDRLNRRTSVLNLHRPTARAARRLAAGKRAGVEMSVSDPGQVRLRLRARIDGRVVVLARAQRKVSQGGLVRLVLKLSPNGQAELQRRGRMRVAVVATYSEAFNAQRATLTLTQVDGGRR